MCQCKKCWRIVPCVTEAGRHNKIGTHTLVDEKECPFCQRDKNGVFSNALRYQEAYPYIYDYHLKIIELIDENIHKREQTFRGFKANKNKKVSLSEKRSLSKIQDQIKLLRDLRLQIGRNYVNKK